MSTSAQGQDDANLGQRVLQQDDGLFFTGFSLFIVPGLASTEEATLRFDLPAGWRASTPQLSAASGDGTFRAANLVDLSRNCLFLGTHLEETVSLEGFTFVLALGGELKAKKQLFVDAMAPLLPAYVEMFGGMPLASRYLVVINNGDRSDGGAFLGSYSMLIKGKVSRGSAVLWGHGIAHELAHFWNGHAIAPASEHEEEWFKEGFTDYLTIVHLSVDGTNFLDIGPAFEGIGLRLTTMMDEFYVSEREDATPAQRAMAASIFGQ